MQQVLLNLNSTFELYIFPFKHKSKKEEKYGLGWYHTPMHEVKTVRAGTSHLARYIQW